MNIEWQKYQGVIKFPLCETGSTPGLPQSKDFTWFFGFMPLQTGTWRFFCLYFLFV